MTTSSPHPVPDRHGANLFTTDPDLRALLALYLPAPVLEHLLPHLEHLGGLAGGVLDALAQTADRNPPELLHRTRAGVDAQRIVKHPAYVELERVAFSQYGLAAMSHRAGVLGWDAPLPPAAKYALTYLFVQAEFGLCCPLSMTDSLARTLRKFGAPALVERFLPKLTTQVFDDLHQGAMFMTEQGAGSDVAATATRAVPDGDGWRLYGDKWFCSNPDAALAMVLARVDGAPPGTKGLSLFIVPRVRVSDDGTPGEDNDVSVASIEHKMGINGSATCVLNFGENGKCIGELVGDAENVGIMQMFLMMNSARISVGIQGVAVASSAYLNALEYAKDRKQGAPITNWKDATAPRVAIVEHADVRRMLLEMKAKVEGCRALICKLANHHDHVKALKGKDDTAAAYHQGQVDLLVPLVKAYSTDQAFRVCELAIQTYGGAGYLKDHPAEQAARDSKIFSIYEGTNHIQAMDLVGRKLPQNGGANLQAFLGDVGKFVSANSGHAKLGPLVKELSSASEAFGGIAMQLLGWFQSGKMQMVPLAANRVLEMMSEVAIGWLLLEQARIAIDASEKLPEGDAGAQDRAFYAGKVHAATFYAKNVLPNVKATAEVLGREDTSPIDIPLEAFATV